MEILEQINNFPLIPSWAIIFVSFITVIAGALAAYRWRFRLVPMGWLVFGIVVAIALAIGLFYHFVELEGPEGNIYAFRVLSRFIYLFVLLSLFILSSTSLFREIGGSRTNTWTNGQ